MVIHYSGEKKVKQYCQDIEKVFSDALMEQGFDPSIVEVDLMVVSPRMIKKINKEYRAINKVTDILSFPNLLDPKKTGMQVLPSLTKEEYKDDINYETGNIMLGSMYLNYHQAKKQSKLYGTTIQREVVYLCLHSLLHLIGYDHMIEADKKIMRQMEEKILEKNGIPMQFTPKK